MKKQQQEEEEERRIQQEEEERQRKEDEKNQNQQYFVDPQTKKQFDPIKKFGMIEDGNQLVYDNMTTSYSLNLPPEQYLKMI